MASIPSASELYGGDPVLQNEDGTVKAGKLAQRHADYQKVLNKSIEEGLKGDVIKTNGVGDGSVPTYRSRKMYEREMANMANEGGLKKTQGELVARHVSEMLNEPLRKEWTLSAPVPSGIVPFDLEAPSKLLFPRPTPFRNSFPRIKGQGASHRIKVIDGVTGSGTANITSMNPGFLENATTVTPGSGINLVRPNYIQYAGYDQVQTFVSSGLSDAVTWQAEYQSHGFDDVRSLSATSLLYASMLAEERTILFGRGTVANGYSGPLSAPASVTATAVAASVAPSSTATAFGTGSVWYLVAADAGDLISASGGMHQGPTTTAASVAVTAGQAIQVTVGSGVTGALGYNLYVASVQAGPYYLAGRSGYNIVYAGGQPSSGPSATAGAADASAFSYNYDGLFANGSASAGYTKVLNAPLSTTNPGVEFFTAMASLYDSVKGSPDELWLNGWDRLQLSNALLNNSSTTAYRVFIPNQQSDDVKVGAIVQSLLNPVTGDEVAVNAHPWFPQGAAFLRQRTLPIPQTNISETYAVACAQDYIQVNWPAIDMTYQSSTFWISTLVSYAPQWQGFITGIQGVGVPALFPSEGDG